MVTVLCGVAFHIKWNIILWISIRPVLPMVASEKMLQVLSLWLGSAVPPSEKLENPAVFSFLSGTSRLFLELFQGVGTYVFLLAVTNNSSESFHHLIWFWGAYQSSGCLEFTDFFFCDYVIVSWTTNVHEMLKQSYFQKTFMMFTVIIACKCK